MDTRRFIQVIPGIIVVALTAITAGGAAYALAIQSSGAPKDGPIASSEQKVFLADGAVTLAEREEAAQRAVACIVALGLAPEIVPGAGLRRTRVNFAAPTLELAKNGHRCIATHLDAVDEAYASQQSAKRPISFIDDANGMFSVCVARISGIAPSVEWAGPELVARVGAPSLAACSDGVEEATGYRPW